MNSSILNEKVNYAGFWLRLIADIIDTSILTAASWILEFIALGAVFWVKALFSGSHSEFSYSTLYNSLLAQIINLLIYFALATPYYVIGHFRYGTTLGKWPLSIYVVRQHDLGPITLKQSSIRFASYLLSYLVFATGFLMAAYHPKKLALHDLIAGTASIKRSGYRRQATAKMNTGENTGENT